MQLKCRHQIKSIAGVYSFSKYTKLLHTKSENPNQLISSSVFSTKICNAKCLWPEILLYVITTSFSRCLLLFIIVVKMSKRLTMETRNPKSRKFNFTDPLNRSYTCVRFKFVIRKFYSCVCVSMIKYLRKNSLS